MTDVPIRDASTVIVLRDTHTTPKVLMGQRGKTAAFMPDKFVFPGGAVDPADAQIELDGAPHPDCVKRLDMMTSGSRAHALLACAIRELWEETGQILGKPSPDAASDHPDWTKFHATGHLPSATGLRYVFRAITPPGRPRRFDVRFFMLDVSALASDPDDFSNASDELSHLHWVSLPEARQLNLPFITEVVLAEIASLATTKGPPDSVPFFKNDQINSQFLRLT